MALRRTVVALATVAVVGAAAVVAIVLLEQRAESSRDAQISLAQISAQLTQLELVPLASGLTTGHTAAPVSVRMRAARELFAQREGRIRAELATLQAGVHPAALDRIEAPLNTAIETARTAVSIWVAGNGFTAASSALLTRQGSTVIAALQALDGANRAYGTKAATLDTEAVAGAAIAVSLLLAAFAFVYRRSDNARAALHDQSLTLKRALSDLEQAQLERARLMERTVQVAERERMRLAADLHDGPIQRLSAVTLAFDLLANQFARNDYAKAVALVDDIRDRLAAETVALRQLMTELRPPILDERGLRAALRDCSDQVFENIDASCRVDVSDQLPDLGPEIETVVFRVVREALINVRKHAPSSNVEVALTLDGDQVFLSIGDDGPGFDTDVQAPVEHAGNGHFGLLGMRERIESVGGTWALTSRPGSGTRICAMLPLNLKEGEAPAAPTSIAA